MFTRVLTSAACAAALLCAVPAPAAGTGGSGQGAIAALAGTVASFYQSRGNAPVWFRDGSDEAAQALAEILRRAPLDGFKAGPKLAAAVEAARVRSANGDPAAVAEAERLLSSAWVAYVQAISWPAPGVIYGDPAVVPKAPLARDILRQAAEARSLPEHLRSVSAVNPLYAELRKAAWQQRQLGTGTPDLSIAANLQRAKALPAGGRYLLVDIATQRLWMMENGRPVDSMRVIVGKLSQRTPLIASLISHATFNPYWNVPADLARRNIAPKVLRQGTSYLTANGYEVLSDWTDQARLLSPGDVDWAAVADGRQEVRIRQRPSAANMMGEVKFGFPNDRGIYLHDTPDKSLFAEEQRTFSSGCVRLEDARRLARWLLRREPAAPSGQPEQEVALPEPVPVYLTYLTVQPSGGELAQVPDIYGLDRTGERLVAGR